MPLTREGCASCSEPDGHASLGADAALAVPIVSADLRAAAAAAGGGLHSAGEAALQSQEARLSQCRHDRLFPDKQ